MIIMKKWHKPSSEDYKNIEKKLKIGETCKKKRGKVIAEKEIKNWRNIYKRRA